MRLVTTASIAGLAALGTALAAALASAPASAATNPVECDDTSVTSLCSTTGHPGVAATPGGAENPMGNPAYGPFGTGPAVPIWIPN